MPAAFQSISNDTYAAKSTTTVSAPTGIQDGDLLLGFLFVYRTSTPDPPGVPSGWAYVPGTWPITLTPIGEYVDCHAYYKVAASESGSYSWTHGAAYTTQGVVMRVSGADTTTPFDVTPSQANGTGATVNWTGVTTVTDGALIVAVEWDYADNTTDTVVPTGTTPTFTERLDVVLTYAATGVLSPAGATGSKTHTGNSTGASPWAATLIAVRPGTVTPTTILSSTRTFGPSYAAQRAASI